MGNSQNNCAGVSRFGWLSSATAVGGWFSVWGGLYCKAVELAPNLSNRQTKTGVEESVSKGCKAKE